MKEWGELALGSQPVSATQFLGFDLPQPEAAPGGRHVKPWEGRCQEPDSAAQSPNATVVAQLGGCSLCCSVALTKAKSKSDESGETQEETGPQGDNIW